QLSMASRVDRQASGQRCPRLSKHPGIHPSTAFSRRQAQEQIDRRRFSYRQVDYCGSSSHVGYDRCQRGRRHGDGRRGRRRRRRKRSGGRQRGCHRGGPGSYGRGRMV
ncbi:hypothetical protein OC846_006458, partial [Tilletia horrida]